MKMDMPDLVDRRRWRRNREPEDVERDHLGRVSFPKISLDDYESFQANLRKSTLPSFVSTADGFALTPRSGIRSFSIDFDELSTIQRSHTDISQRKWPEERLPIDLEPIPGFNLRAQVVGQGGENVKYIQENTRAKVQIKGFGSGFKEIETGMESNEPMYLHIT